MIILEGTDCAGKTTLAFELVSALAQQKQLSRFVRYGILPPWWDYCQDYIRDIAPWVVADRFIVSEIVYGNVVRGGPNSKLTKMNKSTVASALRMAGTLTVYVRPSKETISQRLAKRGDKLFNKDQILRCYDEFDRVLGYGMMPIFLNHYDGTHMLTIDGAQSVRDAVGIIVERYKFVRRTVDNI